MDFTELARLLKEQNDSGNGFQIHLNAGDIDEQSKRNTDVEISELYFTNCQMLGNVPLLSFNNDNREPVSHAADGTPLYPLEIDSNVFIDVTKIELVEDVGDGLDWFLIPTSRVINLYMYPNNDNMDGHRNVVTIGFIK